MPGKYYQETLAGQMFVGATVVAGTTIPVQATNLVSTFTFWNPAGSGVNMELVRYTLGLTTTVTVVGDISIYAQSQVGSAVTAPGTLTAGVIRPMNLGGPSASLVSFYTAATLVNVTGTNFFRMVTVAGPGAVTANNVLPINYDFDGSMIVPPGTLITTAGFAAQTAAMDQTLTWIERKI